ncbi:hypothetical protein GQR36_03325 [Enterococcus termitis]
MKWIIIISSFAVSLLLTGCQLNERSEESSMLNNRSDSSNVASRSGNNLPLKETEYGREPFQMETIRTPMKKLPEF